MVCIKGKSLVLTGIYTTALLSLQAKAEIPESCKEDDVFWDEEDRICRTCTKCSPGMQTTVDSCGGGVGSQGECEPCAKEYYQDRQHTKEGCQRCVQCEADNGVELEPCSDVQNRVCGCKPGYGGNPLIANTCLRCDLWTGRTTLKGCEMTTQRTTTTLIQQPNATDDPHIPPIPPSPTYKNALTDAVKGDQGLSFAVVITISILFVLLTLFLVIAIIAICRNYRRQGPQTMRMNNEGVIGTRSYSKPGVPSLVVTLENGNSKNSKPVNNHLIPTLDLQSLEKWTPNPTPGHTPGHTPRHTPRSTPKLNRSISAPCGDESPYSDQNSFSPGTDTVEEEQVSTQTPLLALPENVRKGAIKCQQQQKRQKMEEDKQKARSIGASFSLHNFLQDYNAVHGLSQMLEINENSIKSDWRNLAAVWGYSNTHITSIIARKGNSMGLMLLLEHEDSIRFEEKNLENLLDSLEEIERKDAVQHLVQYLMRSSSGTKV